MSARGDLEALSATASSFLYLLSLSAITLALAAWLPDYRPEVAGVCALALGAALAAGEMLAPHFDSIDEVRRGRIRVFAVIVYAGLVLLTFVKALGPDVLVTITLVQVMAVLQPAYMVFVGLSRGPGPVVTNALVLLFLAAILGGPVAELAALAAVALLGAFLVFDHYRRVLTIYPSGPGRRLGLAWRDVARTVLPGVLLLAAVLRVATPMARAPRDVVVDGKKVAGGVDWRILRAVVIIWVGGTTAVYVVGRFMRRKPDEAGPVLEILEPIRGPVERVSPPGKAPLSVSYPGLRGRIVRAYVRLRAEAARFGIACPPDSTAHEFERAVGEPADRLASLTRAFDRARYGPLEPDEEEALAAEADFTAIRADLQRRYAARVPHSR